jgi:hypothetical protein
VEFSTTQAEVAGVFSKATEVQSFEEAEVQSFEEAEVQSFEGVEVQMT